MLVCLVVTNNYQLRNWLLNEDEPGLWGQQHFAQNQLFPNMLRHVREKQSERFKESTAVKLNCLLSLNSGDSFMVECWLNKTWRIH